MPDWEHRSTARVVPAAHPRKLAKVPFVELADGRLQGVVSSGSDVERVYVSSIAAGDHAYACSTNNNRPCGGARGGMCNHLRALVDEAVLQYGAERVVRYLRVDVAGVQAAGSRATGAQATGSQPTGPMIVAAMHGAQASSAGTAAAAPVFSRFLRHLAYLELPATTAPLPEMHWFGTAA